MNINDSIVKKHLLGEKFTGFPSSFGESEEKIVLEVLSDFRVSYSMNSPGIWEEIAVLESQQQISSDLMLVVGISKLMRGEVLGLLWLRSNLSKFPTAKNLHAYFIALCQLVNNKERIKPLLKEIIHFIGVQYPNYSSFVNPGFLTESFSVLPYADRDLLITLENTFRNACTRDIFLNGYWTLDPELKWMDANLSNGDVLVDIGANAGVYTLCGSKIVGEKGTVFSFEPNPMCVGLIKKSIELNKLSNVTLVSEAVSDKEEMQDFVLYAASDQNHIKPLDETRLVSRSTIIGTMKIKVTTLDNYFTDVRLTRLDIIKIDAEGCEKFVLDGGLEIIRQFKPKLILEINERVFQPNGYNGKDLVRLLKGMNYSIFRLWQNRLIELSETGLQDSGKSFNIIAISEK